LSGEGSGEPLKGKIALESTPKGSRNLWQSVREEGRCHVELNLARLWQGDFRQGGKKKARKSRESSLTEGRPAGEKATCSLR